MPRLGDPAPSPFPAPVLPPIGDIKLTRITELRPFIKNINCKFMVIKSGICFRDPNIVSWLMHFHTAGVVEDAKWTKDGGYIYSFRVADESGAVIANFWNEVGAAMKPGDIILMMGG